MARKRTMKQQKQKKSGVRRTTFVWAFAVMLGILPFVMVNSALEVQAVRTSTTPDGKDALVTIDVKDTDIGRVLDAFSQQTGLSVVVGKEVTGTVTVKLFDVAWDQALDAVLKPYGFGYERTGDVVVVMPLDKLAQLNEASLLSSRVFKLKYRDANDLKPVIEAQLSPRGKVQVMEETGQKGWDFGAFGASGSGSQASRSAVGGVSSPQRSYRGNTDRRSKTKTLVVSDIPTVLDRVAGVITELDTMPQQILIEARFLEVDRDRLKDLGVDYGTGSSGATTAAVEGVDAEKSSGGTTISTLGGQILGALATPSAFGAKSSTITAVNPFNTGLSLAFSKLTGTQFQVLLHALEEDIHTNTLSAPSIVTLDNQEANILVGTQFPILTSSVAGTTSTTTVSSLDYYQDIGVQLRVVPQISGEDHINMIVHPAVSSIAERITAEGTGGVTAAVYPVLTTREAETQVLMKSGETIMMGGMLQDVKVKGYHKVPILGDIPLIGMAFRRETDDIGKIDLLIFITAKIGGQEQVATVQPAFVPNKPGPKTQIRWQQTSSLPESGAFVRQAKAAQ